MKKTNSKKNKTNIHPDRTAPAGDFAGCTGNRYFISHFYKQYE